MSNMGEFEWAVAVIGTCIGGIALAITADVAPHAMWIPLSSLAITAIGVPLRFCLASNSWSARRMYNRYLPWKLDRAEKAKGWRLETLRLKEQLRAAESPTEGAELSLVERDEPEEMSR